MTVSSDFVTSAYRVLLGREPDLEGLRHHVTSANDDVFLQNLLGSAEFRHRRPALAAPDVWVWADTRFGFRLRVNLADANVSRDILRHEFEPWETKFVLDTVREGDTVLDIGANLGFYTNLLAHRVGAPGRVHAFEALPYLCESVRASVSENHFEDRVTIHCAALSDKEGEASLIYSEGGNWGGAHLMGSEGLQAGQIETTVPTTTLNALPKFERLSFIKLDVEGAEPLVMQPFLSELGSGPIKVLA